MSVKYSGNYQFANSFKIGRQAPIDERFVVLTLDDLTNGTSITNPYTGLVVYVESEEDLYVLTATDAIKKNAKNIEYWKKFGLNSNKSKVIIVSSVGDLTDESIEDISKGALVYVDESQESDSEDNSGLYVLIDDDSTSINNWIKVSGAVSSDFNIDDYLSINENAPLSGNGIRITDTQESVLDYISDDNTIKADEFYTSFGLNSYDSDDSDIYDYEYITLSNGGSSYIKLFDKNGENWISMNLVDDSLGFTLSDVKVKSPDGTISDYTNETEIPVGTFVSFGSDVDFNGFDESRSNGENYIFGETGSTYENVDIYSESKIIDTYAYNNGNSVRLLTELDKESIDDRLEENADRIESINDKVDNIYNTILIDLDGEGSEEPSTLQDVIVNMNNAISKLNDIDDVYNPSEAFDDNLSMTSAHGGLEIKTVKDFKDSPMTYDQMFDAILFPTIQPTATQPSITLSYSGNRTILVGTTLPVEADFSATTNRGSVTYGTYNLVDGEKVKNPDNSYAGQPGEITYTINNGDTLWGTVSEVGTYTVKCSTTFENGGQPYDNKGNDATVAPYSSSQKTNSISITACYDVYATTSQLGVMTKQTLRAKSSWNGQVLTTIPEVDGELSVSKFRIDVPTGWVISAKQENPTKVNVYDVNVDLYKVGTTTYKDANDRDVSYDIYTRTSDTKNTLTEGVKIKITIT